MMQIMTYEQALKRGLVQTFSEKRSPMSPNTWKPILTKEQEEQQRKDIESGVIPF
jgi:hypothetical protein